MGRPGLGFGSLLTTAIVAILASGLVGLGGPRVAEGQEAGQVRALWVDAFHDGIKSPPQVAKLVADARRANINTLLVQVRKRGDLYYFGGPEPRAGDQPPDYDALRTLLDAAHDGSPRLEVHAWIPALALWNPRSSPPADPNHLFNRHGPTAAGEENWLMQRDDGETWTGEGYWLDPGHPAVAAYLVELAADLVRRYEVDGLHLDRLRYFEGASNAGVRDHRWGYNPASVARFDFENGRAGQPDPNDAAWAQFRRDRVTELLGRLREAALAVRPGVKVSAALIPWGPGPESLDQWRRAAAYADVFQDWRAWLELGLLDQAYVMTYNSESSPTEAAWFDRWLAFERANSAGRQVVAGIGAFKNDPAGSVRQIRRAQSAEGGRLAGVALYSYASPDASRINSDPSDDTPDGLLWDVLTQPAAENDFSPPFAEAVGVPPLTWR